MSLWTVISGIVPFVGLATLWAAVHYSKKAAAYKEQLRLSALEIDTLKTTIQAISDNYQAVDKLRKQAENRADAVQNSAAELARQIAANPDTEASAREAAVKLKELLNGLP